MAAAFERRVKKLERHMHLGDDSDLTDDELKRIIAILDKADRSETERVELRQLEARMAPIPDYIKRLTDEQLAALVRGEEPVP